jgi:hypothetical protein
VPDYGVREELNSMVYLNEAFVKDENIFGEHKNTFRNEVQIRLQGRKCG